MVKGSFLQSKFENKNNLQNTLKSFLNLIVYQKKTFQVIISIFSVNASTNQLYYIFFFMKLQDVVFSLALFWGDVYWNSYVIC